MHKILWNLLLSLLIIIGILLSSILTLDYGYIKELIDSAASDGTASTFNKEWFSQFRIRSILALVYIMTLIILGFIWRKWFYQTLEQLLKTKLSEKAEKFTKNKWLIGLTIIGLAFRIYLGFDAITYDEAFTYNNYISKSWIKLLTDYTYPNNHIFHNILAKLCNYFGQGSAIGIRVPSITAGTLCIPFCYSISLRLYQDEKIAIFSSSIIALLPYLVEYSSLARGYSLIGLLSIITIYCFLRLKENNNDRWILLTSLSSSLCLWTSPASIIVITCMIFGFHRELKNSLFTFLKVSPFIFLPLTSILLIFGIDFILDHPETNFHRTFTQEIIHGWKDFKFHFIDQNWLLLSFLLIIFTSSLFGPSKKKLFFFTLGILVSVLASQKVAPMRVYTTFLIISLPFLWVPKLKNWLLFIFPIILSIQLFIFGSKTLKTYHIKYSEILDLSKTDIKNRFEGFHVTGAFPLESPIDFYFDTSPNLDKIIFILSKKRSQDLNVIFDHYSKEKYNIAPLKKYINSEIEVFLIQKKI